MSLNKGFSRMHYPANGASAGKKLTKFRGKKPRKLLSLERREKARQREIHLLVTNQAEVVVKSKGRLKVVQTVREKKALPVESRHRRYKIGKAMEGVSREQEIAMQAEFIAKHGVTECPSKPCRNRSTMKPKNRQYRKGRMS